MTFVTLLKPIIRPDNEIKPISSLNSYTKLKIAHLLILNNHFFGYLGHFKKLIK